MPPRPSRAVRAATLPVVAALVLAGAACSPVNRQPTEFNAEYRENFMFGCTGVEEGEQPVLSSREYCQCLYEGVKERVGWDEAKAFDEEQAQAESGEDIEIPRTYQAVIRDCRERTDPDPDAAG